MSERLQKIADDLGTNVYKDALHGQIARDNFTYGVKQAESEIVEIVRNVCDSWADLYTRKIASKSPQSRIVAVGQYETVDNIKRDILAKIERGTK